MGRASVADSVIGWFPRSIRNACCCARLTSALEDGVPSSLAKVEDRAGKLGHEPLSFLDIDRDSEWLYE